MGEFHIEPTDVFKFELFGQTIAVKDTLLIAFGVTAAIILLCLIIRIFFIPRFKKVPKGFQLVLEYIITTIDKFTLDSGGPLKPSLAPYFLAICSFIFFSGMVELLGIRAPISYLNTTAALAIMSFVLINAYAIKAKGVWGRIKSYGKPIKLMAPIKFLTDLAVPISLACRMFGNMLGGMIIMELLYSVLLSLTKQFIAPGILAAVLPGIFSIYFTVFHTAIQVYIFSMLSLTFIGEAAE